MTSGFDRKRFKFATHPYPYDDEIEDCKKIQEALLREHGLIVDLSEAYWMWQMYSNSVCAGWIILPEDNKEIAEILID